MHEVKPAETGGERLWAQGFMVFFIIDSNKQLWLGLSLRQVHLALRQLWWDLTSHARLILETCVAVIRGSNVHSEAASLRIVANIVIRKTGVAHGDSIPSDNDPIVLQNQPYIWHPFEFAVDLCSVPTALPPLPRKSVTVFSFTVGGRRVGHFK